MKLAYWSIYFFIFVISAVLIIYTVKINNKIKKIEAAQKEINKRLGEAMLLHNDLRNFTHNSIRELKIKNTNKEILEQAQRNEMIKYAEMKRLFTLLIDKGVSIYCWERKCYACKKMTKIYTYYLSCDIAKIDEAYNNYYVIGIGNIEVLDLELSKRYHTVKYVNGKEYHYANFCEHCGKIQGNYYVVDDPEEIMEDLFHGNMDKYIIDTIDVKRINFTINDLDFI